MERRYAVATCFDDMATSWIAKLTSEDLNNKDNFGIKDPYYLIPIRLTEEFFTVKEFIEATYSNNLDFDNLTTSEAVSILYDIFTSETFFGPKMERIHMTEIK